MKNLFLLKIWPLDPMYVVADDATEAISKTERVLLSGEHNQDYEFAFEDGKIFTEFLEEKRQVYVENVKLISSNLIIAD